MKNKTLLPAFMIGIPQMALACPLCNKSIRKGIYDSQFYPNLFTLLSAFIVLAVLVTTLALIATKRHKTRLGGNPNGPRLSPVPLATASMVLGVGIGGFIDGIVFHQIFQAHEMLSSKVPATNYVGKSVNMFWDGIFHFFCLLVVLLGIFLLWKLSFKQDIDRSGRLLGGGLLMGWGMFNIVDFLRKYLHEEVCIVDSGNEGKTFTKMAVVSVPVLKHVKDFEFADYVFIINPAFRQCPITLFLPGGKLVLLCILFRHLTVGVQLSYSLVSRVGLLPYVRTGPNFTFFVQTKIMNRAGSKI